MNRYHTKHGDVAISEAEAECVLQRQEMLRVDEVGPYLSIAIRRRQALFHRDCERAALAKAGARFRDKRPLPMIEVVMRPDEVPAFPGEFV